MYSTINYYDINDSLFYTEIYDNKQNNIEHLFNKTNTIIRNYVYEHGYYCAKILSVSKNGLFYFLVNNCFVPNIGKINLINLNTENSNNNINELNKHKAYIRDLIISCGLQNKSYVKILNLIKGLLSNNCLYIDIIGFNINFRNSIEKHVDIDIYLNAIVTKITSIDYFVVSDLKFLCSFLTLYLKKNLISKHYEIEKISMFLCSKYDFIKNISVMHFFDNSTAMNFIKFIILPKYKFNFGCRFDTLLYLMSMCDNNFCLSLNIVPQLYFKHVGNFGYLNILCGYINNINSVILGKMFNLNKSLKYFQLYHNCALYSIDINFSNYLDLIFIKDNFCIKYFFMLDKSFILKNNFIFNFGIGYTFFINQTVNYINSLSGVHHLLIDVFGHEFNYGNLVFDSNILILNTQNKHYLNKIIIGILYGSFKGNLLFLKYAIPLSFYFEYDNEIFGLNIYIHKLFENYSNIHKNNYISNIITNIIIRFFMINFTIDFFNCKFNYIDNNESYKLIHHLRFKLFINLLSNSYNFFVHDYFNKFDIGFIFINKNLINPYFEINIKDFV